MSNWIVADYGRSLVDGVNAAATNGTLVNAGANFAKGGYTPITTSVPFTANGMFLTFQTETVSHRFALDVAVGDLGNEVVVVSDLIVSSWGMGLTRVWLPVAVQQGQRVSVRASTSNASATSIFISLRYSPSVGLSPMLPNSLVTCNVNPATIAATVPCDAGALIHTKGEWFELTASTPRNASGFLLHTNTGPVNGNAGGIFLIDIGVGAQGSETPIVRDIPSRSTSSGALIPGHPPVFFLEGIPAGQRISARVQSNFTNANTRIHGVSLYLA